MNTHGPDDVLYLGRVDFRNSGKLFGIRRADRAHHVYTIGRTGTGKSTLLMNMVGQDLANGEGVALLDPHGDLADAVFDLVPEQRRRDLVFLCPGRTGGGFTFNPFADVPPARRSLVAAGIVEVFRKLWPDDWGPRLEHLLRNVVFTLLEVPDSSLGDIPRLLSDRAWRRPVVERLSNSEVQNFWLTEYERYSPAFRAVVTAPLQNKVGAFLTDPLLRHILTAPKSSFSVPEIMDRGRVLVANLAKGRIGEGPAALLGSLLVSHITLAGLARAEVSEDERRDFWVYLDEFQTFGTLTLVTMLSELRKYRVGLTLAHQYLGQLQPEVRDAVLGNAGTLLCFRVGAQDAPLLARELTPTFAAEDLVNLPNYRIYLRLMVDAAPSQPFSAVTLAPTAAARGGPRPALSVRPSRADPPVRVVDSYPPGGVVAPRQCASIPSQPDTALQARPAIQSAPRRATCDAT